MNDAMREALLQQAFTMCPQVAALNLPHNLGAVCSLSHDEERVITRLRTFSYWPIVFQAAHEDTGMDEETFYRYLPATMKFLAVCAFTSEDVAMRNPTVDQIWHAAQSVFPVYALLCVYGLGQFVSHIPDLSGHSSPTNGDYCCKGSIHCTKTDSAALGDTVAFPLGLLIKQIQSSQVPITLSAKQQFFATYERYFGPAESFWEPIPAADLAGATA